MISLERHYDNMYQQAVKKFRNGWYKADDLIDSAADDRFGLTLVIRPPQRITNEISKVLERIYRVEPGQYFYPESDMHITVTSIISCVEGFSLVQIDAEKYISVIKDCLRGFSAFNLELRGITASPECLMVQGFPGDGQLNQLRDKLKESFNNSGLLHSIDKRYTIRTAHSTIFRIKNDLKNQKCFIETINKYRDHEFGKFSAGRMELVYNDWYHRKKSLERLYEFPLKNHTG